MLTRFFYVYRRLIPVALLLAVVLSVLHICVMTANEAYTQHGILVISAGNNGYAVGDFSESHCYGVLGSGMLNYDQCRSENACYDCGNDSMFFPLIASLEHKSLYALLYSVAYIVLDETRQISLWQNTIEPAIRSSLPPVYITKTSFLE